MGCGASQDQQTYDVSAKIQDNSKMQAAQPEIIQAQNQKQ